MPLAPHIVLVALQDAISLLSRPMASKSEKATAEILAIHHREFYRMTEPKPSVCGVETVPPASAKLMEQFVDTKPAPPSPAKDPLPGIDEQVLQAALKVVTGSRRKAYGHPEDNFKVIAELWDTYLAKRAVSAPCPPTGYIIGATDVAAMMALMKIARIAETPDHADSWTDLAGYAACGARTSGAKL